MIIEIKNLIKNYKDFKAVDIKELNIKEGESFGNYYKYIKWALFQVFW